MTIKHSKLEEINLSDYSYTLPEDRIAKFPLEARDEAKLLTYQKGQITHNQFHQLPTLLPENTLLVFNNTKVIPARLHFQRKTGAVIEIFLLQPEAPKLVSLAMQTQAQCVWKCLIGNKRRWKNQEVLQTDLEINARKFTLEARLTDAENQWVTLSWNNSTIRLVDILSYFGELPLPPYIKREATEKDKRHYQTVYSREEGAVAAPTAGLHFTEKVLKGLQQANIQTDFLTLHVGGGTFQPIKTEKVLEHKMHAEQIIFTPENIQKLLKDPQNIISVGTTSMRALESLYWYGVKLKQENFQTQQEQIPFWIEKLYPYQVPSTQQSDLYEALETVLEYMKKHQLKELIGETEIFIFPGYQFRVCQGLITNYHLPDTTLILLVASFVGEDWRKIYQEALDNQYRFLSYGDSSLLIP